MRIAPTITLDNRDARSLQVANAGLGNRTQGAERELTSRPEKSLPDNDPKALLLPLSLRPESTERVDLRELRNPSVPLPNQLAVNAYRITSTLSEDSAGASSFSVTA